ncbi:tyrosine-protein phosphatase [Mycolicibacterium sp. 22603]|uniref:tyrosine-protein phosphatase n=1 Tax=Mycolicibacterium sp. 22603 TaxID=3453950 RepID=UPI003F82B4C2
MDHAHLCEPNGMTAEANRLGLPNFRVVRGVTDSGRVLAGALWRSGAPAEGDPAPSDSPWPPATVIDLRSPSEHNSAHPLERCGSDVHRIPMSRQLNLADFDDSKMPAGGIAALYVSTLIGAREAIAEAIEIVSSATPPVLVHCAAGKDRTGILVAVVLAALGIPREAIVADYVETNTNMDVVMKRIKLLDPAAADKLIGLATTIPEALSAPTGAIEAILDTLDDHGGSLAWLRAAGVGEATLEALQRRMLAPGMEA